MADNTMTVERPHPANVNEAVQTLGDAEYFTWCRTQAEKHFTALIAKRWPHLVRERNPRH